MITEDFITFKGISIAVQLAGEGKRTLIFLHGGSMSSHTWTAQLNHPALANYQMICCDLPGHGDSSRFLTDVGNYRPAHLASLIRTIVEHYQVNQFVLVGLSFGAMVIGESQDYLSNCAGILLISPFVVNDQHPPENIMLPVPFGHVMLVEDPSEEDLHHFVFDNVRTKQIGVEYIESYKKTDPRFRSEFAKVIMEKDWSDEISHIKEWKVPIGVVFGKNEMIVKTDYIQGLFPLWHEQIVRIPEAGHLPNEEEPDAFNKVLLSFCESVFK